MKSDLKDKAIALRKEGYAYSTILDRICVAKSTLSEWLRDVPYKPNEQTLRRLQDGQMRSAKAANARKSESLRLAELEARREFKRFSKRDLFMLGLGVYIGEGAKTHNIVCVSNANPQIIKLAMAWFEDACGIPRENFVMRIHIYPDTDKGKALSYWMEVTGLPAKQFNKTHIDVRTGKSVYKRGILPFGTAHLKVRGLGDLKRGSFLARKIASWSNKAFENAGVV